ncbi:MAG TPA: helix-turn-helix domain-containing protein [Bryobacteraceae bacterium]|nr:helix-turn-helix domain-containing protein [Bryobacteraceae bacterium]
MLPLDLARDPAQASVLLNPGRLRVLSELTEPDSASGVARRLELPRQQVNYYVRDLEKTGFLEFIEERKRGNCLQRVLQATAKCYLVSPEALGRLGEPPAVQPDRFSLLYLLSVAAGAIRELSILSGRADKAGNKLASLTLETDIRFADPVDRHAFAEELTATVARLVQKYNSTEPGSRPFRVLLAAYPSIDTKKEPA